MESLLLRIMSSRGYGLIQNNCLIEIDGVIQRFHRCPYPQTMDITGIDKQQDPSCGEMYECKVGQRYLNSDDLNFMCHLISVFNKRGCQGLLVGLVCLEGKNMLINHVEKKLKMKFQNIISRENLLSLWEYDEVKKLIS
ncbi:MAG: hypothetical protein K6T66_14240 [Peptococcaceae bacterium]|nr:hypothetical protein [Peptococcaceae bacterium]